VRVVDSVRARLDHLALGDAKVADVEPSAARRFARALSAPLVLGRARRRVALPTGPETLTVAVGAASMGGSGKTPVAIACALALAELGVPCVLVGHAYGGSVRAPFVVDRTTPLRDCGDEARVAEAALRGSTARVVVGPTRAEATLFASRLARVLVLDGPLDTRPNRATLRLLAQADEDTGRLARALALRADFVVPTGSAVGLVRLLAPSGEGTSLGRLAGARYGLVSSIARPGRVVAGLGSHRPTVHVRLGNHGDVTPEQEAHAVALARDQRLDLWVATEKGPLFGRSSFAGQPLAFLRHTVPLPDAVERKLRDLATALWLEEERVG
jgi:tetraacyldisaccharide 4'-kinase